MFMSILRYSRRALLLPVTLALVSACGSKPATPAVAVTDDTYAVVNGRQITKADVDKAFQRTQPSNQVLSEEETLAGKLSVLDELIVEDLLQAKARDLKIEVAYKDVDEAYAGFRKNLTQ